MQLAIRQACKHLPVSSVHVFWDDVESSVPQLQWTTTGYSEFTQVQNLSQVQPYQQGWIRQQFAKMSLHRILNDTEWIVLDADTVLRNDWNFDNNRWYYDPDESCNDYWDFAKFAVGVNPTSQRYMSPLWRCERQVLTALEEAIYNKHSTCLEQTFLNSGMHSISEVEMYAQFAIQCMGKTYKFVPHQLRMIQTDQFVNTWNDSTDDVCLGGADAVGQQFWQQWPEIVIN